MSMGEQKMFDQITEITGGKVVFTTYWASALVPDRESWPAFIDGHICDMIHWVPQEHYQRLEWGLYNMPFVGFPSMEATGEIADQLGEEFTEISAAYQGATILPIRAMPPVQLHTVTKQVVLPEDVAGMKLICTGAMARLIDSMGGAAQDVNVGEMYTSLESGLAEGAVNHWPVVSVFGTLPLYNYHTNFGPGGNQMITMSIAIHPETWAKLPADIQQLIYDKHVEIFVEEGYLLDYNEIAKYTADAEEWGHGIVDLTPEQIAVWQEAAAPMQEQWMDDLEAEGHPVRKVYERAKELIAEY
jgi:TRAP-type C4-dicarboxylate transport system substrate-binding protein